MWYDTSLGNLFFNMPCWLQLVMSATAVTIVDKLGRRPLLLGGVSGMVSPAPFLFLYFSIYLIRLYSYMVWNSWKISALWCFNYTLFSHLSMHWLMWQIISLFLLGSYYTFLGDATAVAVVGLVLYFGCYQVSTSPVSLFSNPLFIIQS